MIRLARSTALFGGSFDPVHEGHLHLARSVRQKLPELEQIVFVPAAHSPGKAPPVAPAEDRLRWLRLVAEPAGFPVWDAEISRGGESFTVDTLAEAHRAGALKSGLYWLLGADAYSQFSRWRRPEEIRALCRLLVVNRPGHPLRPQHPDDVILEIPPHPATSSAIREALEGGQAEAPFLPAPVRQDLKQLFCGPPTPMLEKNE